MIPSTYPAAGSFARSLPSHCRAFIQIIRIISNVSIILNVRRYAARQLQSARKRAFIFNPHSIAILNQPCRGIAGYISANEKRANFKRMSREVWQVGIRREERSGRDERVLGDESPLAIARPRNRLGSIVFPSETATFPRSRDYAELTRDVTVCRTTGRSDTGGGTLGRTLHAAKSRDHDPAPEKPPGHRSGDRGKDSPVEYTPDVAKNPRPP